MPRGSTHGVVIGVEMPMSDQFTGIGGGTVFQKFSGEAGQRCRLPGDSQFLDSRQIHEDTTTSTKVK